MNELNAKVAKAMGWTYARSHLLGCYGWSDVSCAWRGREPLFDSDPALLPEMLAWLEDFGLLEILGNCVAPKFGAWVKRCHEPHVTTTIAGAYGATIFEAVARLVVAVAEEKP